MLRATIEIRRRPKGSKEPFVRILSLEPGFSHPPEKGALQLLEWLREQQPELEFALFRDGERLER